MLHYVEHGSWRDMSDWLLFGDVCYCSVEFHEDGFYCGVVDQFFSCLSVEVLGLVLWDIFGAVLGGEFEFQGYRAVEVIFQDVLDLLGSAVGLAHLHLWRGGEAEGEFAVLEAYGCC